MTYMPFEEVPEGWNLARGGWPEADDFFYTKSFKDSNWTQKKLLVGFNITHAHLHALRMDIVGFLKDGKLYDKHFGTKEMDLKFDPMYKAAEAKYDLLRNDDIPRCWRSQALEGFRAMVRKETRPNPDMLDESSPEGRRMVLAPGAVS